jgi:FtsP/CotA-like multicopper oxidase with cupredoxin domain
MIAPVSLVLWMGMLVLDLAGSASNPVRNGTVVLEPVSEPNGMDGVGGLNQKPIEPGETFRYEYPLVQYGTHMYHSHFDEMTQMALGVMGLFVIHPRRPQ